MKITYDKDADVVYIYVQEKQKVADTRAVKTDIIVDFASDGSLIGFEILSASKNLSKKTIYSLVNNITPQLYPSPAL